MTKKIKRAIIPAAGLGTRFLPTTKSTPKELIPLLDKPCIEYIIDEAIAGGIEEFAIVISKSKEQIKTYFTKDEHLESWLQKRGKTQELELIKKIEEKAKYHFVYQEEPLGLGHAVLCAKDFIGDDDFLVLLPDDIIDSNVSTSAQMISLFEKKNQGSIAVMEVERHFTNRYGVIAAKSYNDQTGVITSVVEKPKVEEAPSCFAIIGRYVLPNKTMEMLENTGFGAGGEIQLTDALYKLVELGELNYFAFEGTRYDTGTPQGWLYANAEMGLRKNFFDKNEKKVLKDSIKSL